METMQELIEQNFISKEAAEFLVACTKAQLNIVIWSHTQDQTDILAQALNTLSDKVFMVNLNEEIPTQKHGLVATFVSQEALEAVKHIKLIKADIVVEIINKHVESIIDISTTYPLKIFERYKKSFNDESWGEWIITSDLPFGFFGVETDSLLPTGLRPPVIARLNEANILLPPTVFGLSTERRNRGKTDTPPPPPEPAPAEEWADDDEIVFTDIDDEISKEKAKPDSKPLPPRAPKPASGGGYGVPGKADEDLFSEEEPDEREQNAKEELADTGLKETQFTAYYTRQSAANIEYGFYVYAHLPEALISADIQQFEADLGGRVPKPALATQTASLKEGALLTAMVQCDTLQFNQIGIMKKWESPFVRFDFRYTAPESLIDEFVEGRVAIMLGMIEIASIDFQTLITAPQAINLINTMPDDPTKQAHFEPTNPASTYQKIFISYSRKDTVIAEEFRKAQIMMGNTVFMDTHTIRAGEDWEEALKRFIREADVFQLFWSEYSASSEHCRFEWKYALDYRCSDTRCVGFIRPAYWVKPLPTPPPELGHLHFAYVPQEDIIN